MLSHSLYGYKHTYKCGSQLHKSSDVFASGYPWISRSNYLQIIENNISICCNMNKKKKDRSFGSLRPICCVVIDALAPRWVSFASLGNDPSSFPWNSSPGPKNGGYVFSLLCVRNMWFCCQHIFCNEKQMVSNMSWRKRANNSKITCC